jgi:large subunit ribosomal protein L13
MNQKTFSAKPSDVTRKWYVIDAAEAPLGRTATLIATLLIGKRKPQFTQHIDIGDFVVVINAGNVMATGQKMTDKMYYRHSGYPGGLHEASLKDVLAKTPERAIYQAVRGMLPVNKLRDQRLTRLKIFAGSEHNHSAQKPVMITVKGAK